MVISSLGIVRDTTLLLRDVISGTVTDPVSNRQTQAGDAGSNARFVMTSFPERSIVYPFITVGDVTMLDENLGMGTEDSLSTMRYQVDVWTKQVGQRDGIAGSVFHGLRTSQLEAGGLVGSGLIDFRLVSMRNLDEDGKGGIHRKSMDFEFKFVNTT